MLKKRRGGLRYGDDLDSRPLRRHDAGYAYEREGSYECRSTH